MRKNPRRNLPITANPTMLPFAVAGVIEGHVLKQLDIGRETDTGIGALDQVVTEQSLGREAISHAFAESMDVVNRLAVKYGFAEQILLSVGYRLAVRICAGSIGKYLREAGGSCARQGNADAGLNDGIASFADPRNRIEDHSI